jgi:hypothetical protein
MMTRANYKKKSAGKEMTRNRNILITKPGIATPPYVPSEGSPTKPVKEKDRSTGPNKK